MKTLILAALLAAQGSRPVVIGNPASHIYHTAGCSHFATCKHCSAQFANVADAVKAGFHACPFIKGAKKAGK